MDNATGFSGDMARSANDPKADMHSLPTVSTNYKVLLP